MKKVLSLVLLLLLGGMVTAGFFVYIRFKQNPEQVLPYPYVFQETNPEIKLEAPILVVGDRMGYQFAKFKSVLADTISINLAKPIKVQNLARPGNALHRTIHELKALNQWPQILIYQGASEEFSETKFIPSEIPKIAKNFVLYGNDKIETLLILYPWLSRVIYHPIRRVILPIAPAVQEEIAEEDFIKRLETELLLFEQQLVQLVTLSKNRNTLLILTTTPINLDEPPRKVCHFTATTELESEMILLRDFLKNNNPKSAYTKSTKLLGQYIGNPELLFLHGQISKRLGNIQEARNSLLEASSYDCHPWRATEVQNSMIRKIAKENQILLFDFAKLVEKDYAINTTFFDELNPQNLYYEIGMKQLGLVIKSILKL